MMKTFYPFLLALLMTGCQAHQQETVKSEISVGATVPVSTVAAKSVSATKEFIVADTMPPVLVRFNMVLRTDIKSSPVVDSTEISQFFGKHNLAPLIQNINRNQDDRSMNGFLGLNRYRTEVVITTARKSLQNQFVYLIKGMTRTKKHIVPFQGQLLFDSLAIEPMLKADDVQNIKDWSMLTVIRIDRDKVIKRYSVAGKAVFAETRPSPQARSFDGRVVIELELTKRGKLYTNTPFLHGPSQGGEQKYAGTWTDSQTGQLTPTVWVKNIIGYGPFIHEDFVIGERDVEINPKYAKLGWNELWENDEWWAKSPKPALSL